MDFSYTGRSQVQSLDPGYYKLEVWGAHGGSTPGNNIAFIGGQGGYSVGYLNLTETMTVYVRVGGVGKGVNNDWAEGGYNGGGCACGRASSPGNGGGGGTDIRINEDDIYSRVIVAGGGGGGGREDDGGFGGGLTGGGSNPGKQTSSSIGGAFFQGAHTAYNGGAGGGGWYGGGASSGSQTKPKTGTTAVYTSEGSGGSGYVYNESTAKDYPSGCKLTSKYYLTDASTTGGNKQITEQDGTTSKGHSGDGYARITLIDTDFNYLSSGNDYIVSGFSNSCVNIVDIKLVFGKKVVSIANNAFKDQSCITEVRLPETIKEIGANAFENCGGLQTIYLPLGITMIGESCFSGCNKLKFIYIPNSVSALYPFAFRSCPIEVISIPAGCIVYSKAFDGCTNLKSVEIFDNAIVRSNAFSRCTNISKIVVYEYVALYENSFEDIDSDVFYFGITDFCYPSTETELHRINGTHIFVRNEYVSDKYGKTKAVKCSSSTVSSNKCLCTPYYDNMQRIALRTQRRR